MRQEGFCHIKSPVEIDIHDPFDGGIIEFIETDKGLNDPSVIDDAVNGAVPGDDLFRERLDRVLLVISTTCVDNLSLLLSASFAVSCNVASLMSTAATLAPFESKFKTNSRPIPFPLPVTT